MNSRRTRGGWIATLLAIIAFGMLSRILPIGWTLWDKYLGDALYAAMVYIIIRLAFRWPPTSIALFAMMLMTVIELFQLTLIPAHLAA